MINKMHNAAVLLIQQAHKSSALLQKAAVRQRENTAPPLLLNDIHPLPMTTGLP